MKANNKRINNPGEHIRSCDWFPIEGLSLYAARHTLNKSIEAHDHDCDELVVVTGGNGINNTPHSSYPISTGDVFVSPRGDFHEFKDVRNFDSYVILFDLSKLAIDIKDMRTMDGFQTLFTLEPAIRSRQKYENHLKLNELKLKQCTAIILQIIHELEEQPAGCRFMATALFQQLICLLSRCYADAMHKPANDLMRIAGVISLMEKHYMDHLSPAMLASAANMSERTLRREFHKTLGISPFEYLNILRIRKAEQLLLGSTLNITETAMQCGFCDSNYFARSFRKLNNISPREFRKSYRKQSGVKDAQNTICPSCAIK